MRTSVGPRLSLCRPRKMPVYRRQGAVSSGFDQPGGSALIRTCVFCLHAVLAAGLAFAQPSDLPVLTKIAQIRALSAVEANRGYPVHLRAVVTYYDDVDPNLFIQDATGGNWVHIPHGVPRLTTGELLDLEGNTVQTDFAPDIGNAHWTVLRKVPLPAPLHPPYEEMASTADDSTRVEVEGIVRAFASEKNGKLVDLYLAVAGGTVRVSTPDVSVQGDRLLGARIR